MCPDLVSVCLVQGQHIGAVLAGAAGMRPAAPEVCGAAFSFRDSVVRPVLDGILVRC